MRIKLLLSNFIIFSLTCVFFLLPSHGFAADNLDFPLRAKYPHLIPIETAELASIFDEVIIIDSRNKMEYDVVNMVNSRNLLVGKMKEEDLLNLRSKNDKTPIIFYCNGTTCAKSYKAADKATKWGFKNVKVYDPGIFFWAQKEPTKTNFFAQKLTAETAKNAFISKEAFNAVNLSPTDFLAKAKSHEYTTIEIRDPNERAEYPVNLPTLKALSFDNLVKLLKKGSRAVPKNNLLVFDNVGKQTKWVQYYLEREKVTNYYFLKGGIRQWQADGYDANGNK